MCLSISVPSCSSKSVHSGVYNVNRKSHERWEKFPRIVEEITSTGYIQGEPRGGRLTAEMRCTMERSELGKRIAAACALRGLSMGTLADRIDVSRNTLSRIVTGVTADPA